MGYFETANGCSWYVTTPAPHRPLSRPEVSRFLRSHPVYETLPRDGKETVMLHCEQALAERLYNKTGPRLPAAPKQETSNVFKIY